METTRDRPRARDRPTSGARSRWPSTSERHSWRALVGTIRRRDHESKRDRRAIERGGLPLGALRLLQEMLGKRCVVGLHDLRVDDFPRFVYGHRHTRIRGGGLELAETDLNG